jgi:hypothetical protein
MKSDIWWIVKRVDYIMYNKIYLHCVWENNSGSAVQHIKQTFLGEWDTEIFVK